MIQYAGPQHSQVIRSLWKEVFADTDAFLDLYFKTQYKPEQTIVAIQDGELCASMQLLPYTYVKDAVAYKVVYVFAVMTAPEQRNKGYMGQMMQFLDAELSKQDVAFSFLIPQEPVLFEMYAKYGYLPAFSQAKQLLPLPTNNALSIVPDIPSAYAFYERVVVQYPCIRLNYSQFEFAVLSLREEGGELLACEEGGQLTALCLALQTADSLRVLDIISLNDASKKQLLAALGEKYAVDAALVSDRTYSSMDRLGMAKIHQPELVSIQDLQDVYLSLMMNE